MQAAVKPPRTANGQQRLRSCRRTTRSVSLARAHAQRIGGKNLFAARVLFLACCFLFCTYSGLCDGPLATETVLGVVHGARDRNANPSRE